MECWWAMYIWCVSHDSDEMLVSHAYKVMSTRTRTQVLVVINLRAKTQYSEAIRVQISATGN